MSLFELITSLEFGLIFGIAAIGIYLTFRVIDFPDMTCDGSFVLGAACSGMLLKAGMNPVFALAMAAMIGGVAGLITGILHIYFKVSNLLSGILTAFMLYSINLKVMQGVPNMALNNISTIFYDHNVLLALLIISICVWCAVSFLLSTDLGLALRSVGQNKRFALNYGVQTTKMTIFGLILSNALIGLSGALFSQHQGFVDVSQGLGTIIIGLAAVMIGEKLLPIRSVWFAVLACLVGSILYRILLALALHSEWLGLETQDLNIITGIMILVIMVVPSVGAFKNYVRT